MFENSSYNVPSIVFTYVFSMLHLGHILLSDLLVLDLFVYSLFDMIVRILHVVASYCLFTLKAFLHEDNRLAIGSHISDLGQLVG